MPGFFSGLGIVSGSSDIQWCFSQVKGTLDDDVTEGKTEYPATSTFEVVSPLISKAVFKPNLFYLLLLADIISCVEFNQDGDLLATGDKGGRVVIFQRDPAVSLTKLAQQ